MVTKFRLSKEETKEAEQWRLKKCGSIDFEDLKRCFEVWVRKKRIKEKENGIKRSV
jgi:hypothetical protein